MLFIGYLRIYANYPTGLTFQRIIQSISVSADALLQALFASMYSLSHTCSYMWSTLQFWLSNTVLKWLMSPRWQDWWGHGLLAETSKRCDISWETVNLYGTSTLYPYLSASLLTMPSLAPYRFLGLDSRTTRDMLLSLQWCAGDDLWWKWEFWRAAEERVMVQEKGEGQCSTAGMNVNSSIL